MASMSAPFQLFFSRFTQFSAIPLSTVLDIHSTGNAVVKLPWFAERQVITSSTFVVGGFMPTVHHVFAHVRIVPDS